LRIGLSFFLLLLYLSPVRGAHILGGELFWDCSANNDYIFTLIVYSDCTQTIPASVEYISGPFGNLACSLDQSSNGIIDSSCSDCLSVTYTYRSIPIALSGVPPANGWEFSWSSCCRATGINGLGPGSFYLKSKMYPYTPSDSSGPRNTNICFDNSPKFANSKAMVACQGKYFYNQQATDSDQDSLVVEFVNPLNSSLIASPFATGYSSTSPFPDSTENISNGPNLLNQANGQISLEFYNATPGYYKSAYLIKEYRNGQLIGKVIKDLPFFILDANVCSPNNPPSISLTSNNALPLHQNGNVYRLTAQANDSIDLHIVSQDLDFLPNGSAQGFCLSVKSNKINAANYAADSGCLGGPCATLTPLSSSTNTYCGSIVETHQFNWLIECDSLSSSINRRATYIFHIQVEDNACPVSKSNTVTLLVDVFSSPGKSPTLAVVGGNSSGQVDLRWTKSQTQQAAPFNFYELYYKPHTAASFSPLDIIYDRDSTQATYYNLPFPSDFYLVEHSGSCGNSAPSSDTVSSSLLSVPKDLISEYIKFHIWPQPARSFITINWKKQEGLPSKNIELRLLSIQGQVLETHLLNPNAESLRLKLNHKNGLYLIEMRNESFALRKKLIIN
jgi:hypothetical protein